MNEARSSLDRGRLRHRLVQADAGTGKTYGLAVRFLSLLSSGADARSILAATFTRKAAGEILERILMRLASACLDPRQREELRLELEGWRPDPQLSDQQAFERLLEELCGQLHQLSVSTLDAFFHRVIAMFRWELGVGKIRRVAGIGDQTVSELRGRAAEAMLEEMSANGVDELAEIFGRLYRGDAQRSVAAALDGLLVELLETYRACPERQAWASLPVPPCLDELSLESMIEELAAYGAGLEQRTLVRAIARDVRQAQDRDWRAFLESGLAKPLSLSPPGTHYSRVPIPPHLARRYQPLIVHAGAELIGRIARQTEATHRLLESFDRHFELQRRRANLLLFGDLVDLLNRGLLALSEEAMLDLFYRLDGKVEHLLLDEFQDTSLEQWGALAPLAEEVLAYGDGSRTLFVVGDAKQSIYGWRGACSELFGALAGRFRDRGFEVVSQGVSYRSSPIVLQATNRVFGELSKNPALEDARLQPAANRFQALFSAHEAAHNHLPGFVRLATSEYWEGVFDDQRVFEDDPVDEEAPAETTRPLAHLAYVAGRVVELAARRPDASIGVLVQTNRTVGEVLDRLRDRGLEASGEGGGSISDDPAVTAFLSALLLADHPADTVAWYHVAHSPLAKVLGIAPLGVDVADLSPGTGRQTRKVAKAVRRALAREGAAAVLARWSSRVRPDCDDRNLARLAQLVEIVERYQQNWGGSFARPAEIVRFVVAARVEEPLPARVRVMTVHQAKGLEFDIVVLCELERRLGDLNNPLVTVRRTSPTSPIEAVYRGTNETTRRLSPELQQANQQEIDRRTADDLSVLYVAMTRARTELHAYVQPLRHTVTGKIVRDLRTAASVLRWGLCPDQTLEDFAEGERTLCEIGEPLGAGEGLKRDTVVAVGPEEKAARPATQPITPPATAPASEPVGATAGSPPPARRRLLWSRPSAAARGPVSAESILRPARERELRRGRHLHRWLARIEWLSPDAPVRDSLEGLSVGGGGSEHWEDLRVALERPAIRALFSAPELARGESLTVWRERPYLVELDGHLVRGVFDRVVVFRKADAVLGADLVELKSDRISSSELDRTVALYRPQVLAYREALSKILGVLPTVIRGRLAFLELGEVVEV